MPNQIKIGNSYLPDISFEFSSRVKDPTYEGRHPYNEDSNTSNSGKINTFIPDRTVLLPDPYRGHRPRGYNMFNRFDPRMPDITLDYPKTPKTKVPHQIYTRTFGNQEEPEFNKTIFDSIPEQTANVNNVKQNNKTQPEENYAQDIIRDSGKSYTSIPVVPPGITNSKPVANDKNNNGAIKTDKNYNRNVLYNSLRAPLRHLPTADSIQQYIEAKKNTPDYSDINNAKNYALRPTHVLRQSPTHISSNVKFNPYDYTQEANNINAITANGINTISRQGRGNINALIGHVSNLISQASKSAGDASRKAWNTNEDRRIEVAETNRKADEYNATADNQADSNYIQARNTAAWNDKQAGINALNTYAQRKYDMDIAHKNLLRGLRDQMVGNLGEEGMTAYNQNSANTNRMRNYWTDSLGRHHYLSNEISDAEKMQLAKDFLGSNEFTQWFNNNYKQQNG